MTIILSTPPPPPPPPPPFFHPPRSPDLIAFLTSDARFNAPPSTSVASQVLGGATKLLGTSSDAGTKNSSSSSSVGLFKMFTDSVATVGDWTAGGAATTGELVPSARSAALDLACVSPYLCSTSHLAAVSSAAAVPVVETMRGASTRLNMP